MYIFFLFILISFIREEDRTGYARVRVCFIAVYVMCYAALNPILSGKKAIFKQTASFCLQGHVNNKYLTESTNKHRKSTSDILSSHQHALSVTISDEVLLQLR